MSKTKETLVTAVALFSLFFGADVGYIIAVALPALMFIYPVTIVLILLNVIPERFASARVFKAVVLTTIVFGIPDFLGSVIPLTPEGGTFFVDTLSRI